MKEFNSYKDFLNWLTKDHPSLMNPINIKIGNNFYATPLNVIEAYSKKGK